MNTFSKSFSKKSFIKDRNKKVSDRSCSISYHGGTTLPVAFVPHHLVCATIVNNCHGEEGICKKLSRAEEERRV